MQQVIESGIEIGTTKTGRCFVREENKVDDLQKDFKKYYIKMINKELSKVEMAKLLGYSKSTRYQWVKLFPK